MADYKEKAAIRYSLETVWDALTRATAELKWRVISQERSKMVIKETALEGKKLAIPAEIEIKILPLSDVVGVEFIGKLVGFGAGPTAQIQKQVQDFIVRLYKHLDLIGTPEQQAERQREAEKLAAQQREEEMRLAQEQQAERRAAEERAQQHRLALQQDKEEREAKRKAAQQATQMPGPASPAPTVAPIIAVTSLSEEFERLGRLHQQGILTDEEFTHAKHRLLGL